MIETNIVRHVDDIGRICIPKKIREQYNIKDGDSYELFIDENENLIWKKLKTK